MLLFDDLDRLNSDDLAFDEERCVRPFVRPRLVFDFPTQVPQSIGE